MDGQYQRWNNEISLAKIFIMPNGGFWYHQPVASQVIGI
jgi:hypothetical protein